jgi:hypothetical protein
MAKSNKSTDKGKPTSSPGRLVKTGKDGKVELTENELINASGGARKDGAIIAR